MGNRKMKERSSILYTGRRIVLRTLTRIVALLITDILNL